MHDIHTIIIAGKAGEGVKKAAQVISGILMSYGRHVFQNDDYQSLIKGGHNYSTVSTSEAEVFSTSEQADLIICFDKRSVEERRVDLKCGGTFFYNSDDGDGSMGIGLPMTSLMKKAYNTNGNLCSVPIGIFCALYGHSKQELANIITGEFRKDRDENLALAGMIYDCVEERLAPFARKHIPVAEHLFSGNQLISLGAWTAGLDFYFGYPMTPASSILHYLALQKDRLGVQAIHAESELAAINMAIGASFAGARAAVGSSGGGFALMQEAFSMAGMVEAPLLCILSSRPGPATGVSTYTAQEDLFFAIHQGHGEFARVVASPDSHERAYSLAAELLSLAWELQTPVVLLTEKHLSESSTCLKLQPEQIPHADVKIGLENDDYERYEITDDGISPLLFPPSDSVIKWNSHEHLPSGLRTDKSQPITDMKAKRASKIITAKQAVKKYQQIAEYGEGENIVFAYGSTVLELREAARHTSKPLHIIAPIYLEPFPLEELAIYAGRVIVVVDHSCTGLFASFLKEKLQTKILKNILRYDGRPFDPHSLATLLEEAFDA